MVATPSIRISLGALWDPLDFILGALKLICTTVCHVCWQTEGTLKWINKHIETTTSLLEVGQLQGSMLGEHQVAITPMNRWRDERGMGGMKESGAIERVRCICTK